LLLFRRDSKGITALAASIPLFWIISKKFGGSKDELKIIRAEYDSKLAALREEYDKKLEHIKQNLQSELAQHKLKKQTTEQEISKLDSDTKEFLNHATPTELEELAKGLLSISKK